MKTPDLDEPSLSKALKQRGMTLENHNDILIVRDPKTHEMLFIGSLSKVNAFFSSLQDSDRIFEEWFPR